AGDGAPISVEIGGQGLPIEGADALEKPRAGGPGSAGRACRTGHGRAPACWLRAPCARSRALLLPGRAGAGHPKPVPAAILSQPSPRRPEGNRAGAGNLLLSRLRQVVPALAAERWGLGPSRPQPV